jgi:hypothetical protein
MDTITARDILDYSDDVTEIVEALDFLMKEELQKSYFCDSCDKEVLHDEIIHHEADCERGITTDCSICIECEEKSNQEMYKFLGLNINNKNSKKYAIKNRQ